MYFGMIGAFIFIIIQLVLIVDLAHSWNESWVGKMEDSDGKGWYCGMYSTEGLSQGPVYQSFGP